MGAYPGSHCQIADHLINTGHRNVYSQTPSLPHLRNWPQKVRGEWSRCRAGLSADRTCPTQSHAGMIIWTQLYVPRYLKWTVRTTCLPLLLWLHPCGLWVPPIHSILLSVLTSGTYENLLPDPSKGRGHGGCDAWISLLIVPKQWSWHYVLEVANKTLRYRETVRISLTNARKQSYQTLVLCQHRQTGLKPWWNTRNATNQWNQTGANHSAIIRMLVRWSSDVNH